jgi:hypothetical protein
VVWRRCTNANAYAAEKPILMMRVCDIAKQLDEGTS